MLKDTSALERALLVFHTYMQFTWYTCIMFSLSSCLAYSSYKSSKGTEQGSLAKPGDWENILQLKLSASQSFLQIGFSRDTSSDIVLALQREREREKPRRCMCAGAHTAPTPIILFLQAYHSTVSLPLLPLFQFPPTQVKPGEDCLCVYVCARVCGCSSCFCGTTCFFSCFL